MVPEYPYILYKLLIGEMNGILTQNNKQVKQCDKIYFYSNNRVHSGIEPPYRTYFEKYKQTIHTVSQIEKVYNSINSFPSFALEDIKEYSYVRGLNIDEVLEYIRTKNLMYIKLYGLDLIEPIPFTHILKKTKQKRTSRLYVVNYYKSLIPHYSISKFDKMLDEVKQYKY